jgi:flagellar motility protein MotE (MotC chaperone)
MIRYLRDLRLVPIAVIASACLLVLKAADLMLDSGAPSPVENIMPDSDVSVVRAAPGVPRPGEPQRSWAQQMFNFPGPNAAAPPTDLSRLPAIAPLPADRSNGDIITGSVNGNGEDKRESKATGESSGTGGPEGKAAKGAKEGQPANTGKEQPAAAPPGKVLVQDGKPLPTTAERAILERLAERRQELDKRARELDIREGLITEAEKRIGARLAEIKEGQAQLATAAEKRDEAEAARLKGLVTMYENMKPRDAAKIFDRLDLEVLLEMASRINPRRMSDILAQMSAETAEKLTVELANRAKAVPKSGNSDLPKIEGRPTTQ